MMASLSPSKEALAAFNDNISSLDNEIAKYSGEHDNYGDEESEKFKEPLAPKTSEIFMLIRGGKK